MQNVKRNLRLYFFPLRDAMLFLNWARHSPEYMNLPALPQSIPDGAEVVDMREDYDRRGFSVCVYHPSFPEVPDGEMIPREPGVSEFVAKRIKVPSQKPIPILISAESRWMGRAYLPSRLAMKIRSDGKAVPCDEGDEIAGFLIESIKIINYDGAAEDRTAMMEVFRA